jgi:hypothetical protein
MGERNARLAHSDPAQSDEKPRPMGIKGRGQSWRRRSFGETPWGKFYHQIRPEQSPDLEFCRASGRASAHTVQTTAACWPGSGALSLSTTPLKKPQALAHSASGFQNSLVMNLPHPGRQSQENAGRDVKRNFLFPAWNKELVAALQQSGTPGLPLGQESHDPGPSLANDGG